LQTCSINFDGNLGNKHSSDGIRASGVDWGQEKKIVCHGFILRSNLNEWYHYHPIRYKFSILVLKRGSKVNAEGERPLRVKSREELQELFLNFCFAEFFLALMRVQIKGTFLFARSVNFAAIICASVAQLMN